MKPPKTIITGILILLSLVLLFLIGISRGYCETKTGLSWSYSRAKGTETMNTVNRWYGWVERDLTPNWWFGLEAHYSAFKGDSTVIHGHDIGFKEFGLNLTARRYFWENLFLGGFLGGSYWEPRDKFIDLSGPVLCSFGPLIGYDFGEHVRAEVRWLHSSGPFEPDEGVQYLSVGIGWIF